MNAQTWFNCSEATLSSTGGPVWRRPSSFTDHSLPGPAFTPQPTQEPRMKLAPPSSKPCPLLPTLPTHVLGVLLIY